VSLSRAARMRAKSKFLLRNNESEYNEMIRGDTFIAQVRELSACDDWSTLFRDKSLKKGTTPSSEFSENHLQFVSLKTLGGIFAYGL
jgi:hypothetical protein